MPAAKPDTRQTDGVLSIDWEDLEDIEVAPPPQIRQSASGQPAAVPNISPPPPQAKPATQKSGPIGKALRIIRKEEPFDWRTAWLFNAVYLGAATIAATVFVYPLTEIFLENMEGRQQEYLEALIALAALFLAHLGTYAHFKHWRVTARAFLTFYFVSFGMISFLIGLHVAIGIAFGEFAFMLYFILTEWMMIICFFIVPGIAYVLCDNGDDAPPPARGGRTFRAKGY